MSLINDVLNDLGQRNYPLMDGTSSSSSGPDHIDMVPDSQIDSRFWSVENKSIRFSILLAGCTLCVIFLQQSVPESGHISHSRLSSNHTATAVLPKYIQPQKMINKAVVSNTESATEEKSESPIKPVQISTQEVKPQVRVSERKAIPKPSTKSVESSFPEEAAFLNNAAYLEVTHLPLSAEQQLLSDFHSAANVYKTGNYTEAERQLKDLLVRDASQHNVRLLLARVYVQQKLAGSAESVLFNGLLRYPQHVPYVLLYAQMLAEQGRDYEAIDLLEKALPVATDNAQFHALLAGIYQRRGKSEPAVQSYLAALRLEPTHGEWWMGLGIASEQAGDHATAENAYKEALIYPLNEEIQQYVQQRIQKLIANKAAGKAEPTGKG